MTRRRVQRRGAALGIARWSTRHPWARHRLARLRLLCLVAAARPARTVIADADTGSGQSGRADKVIASAGYPTQITENVLVQPLQAATATEVKAAVAPRAPHPSLGAARRSRRQPAETSADGRSALLPVVLDGAAAPPTTPSAGPPTRPETVQAAIDKVASEAPDLRLREVGDASLEASPRPPDRARLPPGRTAQPAAHPVHPGHRLRCPHCCRCAGAARPVGGGLGDGPVRADVPPVPHSDVISLRDPAHRDGRRRRLLAVLPPP